jgi:hypothetical protein
MLWEDRKIISKVFIGLVIREGFGKLSSGPIRSRNYEPETGLDSQRIWGRLANLALHPEITYNSGPRPFDGILWAEFDSPPGQDLV